MSATLSLVSLNVERSNHLDKVMPFLSKENPDVVCLQELCEPDIPAFEKTLGAKCFYTPVKHNAQDGPLVTEGIGIFSRLKILSQTRDWYSGDPDTIPTFDWSSGQSKQLSDRSVLVTVEIEKDKAVFQIATTHFAWTPDGNADDFQRSALKKLLAVLETKGDFILCGDLNAPRGGEIFKAFADKYTDNIPARYVTSLDRKLHKVGHLNLMVDGLFSTQKYKVTNVELRPGVSDHCAVTATITI